MYSIAINAQKSNPQYKNRYLIMKELSIETHIIGYSSQGEAILIFIRADGKIAYSILVDCYKKSDINQVEKVLQNNHIEKLKFICWTHPDNDHSVGMTDIINLYADKNTQIWIPENVDEHEMNCSQEGKLLFERLKSAVTDKKSALNVYSASDYKNLLYYDSVCFQKGTDIYPLKMFSYTPNSSTIRRQNYQNKFIKNDRSIFFILSLGTIRIWLTGDVEDSTIDELPLHYFNEHVHILKIPHHGSDTSSHIMNLIAGECDVACSTVYRQGVSNLPLANIMNEYERKSDFLLCTGKKEKKDEESSYGMVSIFTDVLNEVYGYSLEGNAILWSEDKSIVS